MLYGEHWLLEGGSSGREGDTCPGRGREGEKEPRNLPGRGTRGGQNPALGPGDGEMGMAGSRGEVVSSSEANGLPGPCFNELMTGWSAGQTS